MKTVIKFSTRMGGELDRIELSDEDATCEAISQALIDMIAGHMSMKEGDILEVIEEEGTARKRR